MLCIQLQNSVFLNASHLEEHLEAKLYTKLCDLNICTFKAQNLASGNVYYSAD